jgi:hypothetical protein
MCSVLAGLTALGGIMNYQQQQAQADAQAEAYNRQAEAAEQNARIEGKRQEQIADKYARESDNLRQRQRIIAGQQRAQAGSAGLGMAGSVMDILSAGNEAYNQDKMTLLSNQRNDNFNSRVTQSNYLNQAASYRSAADNTRSVAKTAGIATILGTAASIYGMGGFGGGGAGSAGGNVAKSTTAPVGTNTTASWSMGNGYSFTPTNSLGNWGHSLDMGTFNRNNYFSYTRGR